MKALQSAPQPSGLLKKVRTFTNKIYDAMNIDIFKIFQVIGTVSKWAAKATVDGNVSLGEGVELLEELD